MVIICELAPKSIPLVFLLRKSNIDNPNARMTKALINVSVEEKSAPTIAVHIYNDNESCLSNRTLEVITNNEKSDIYGVLNMERMPKPIAYTNRKVLLRFSFVLIEIEGAMFFVIIVNDSNSIWKPILSV